MSSLPLAPLPNEPHLRPGRTGFARRLLLWLGLAALFLVLYVLFSPAGGPLEPGSFIFVVGAVVVVTFAGLFGWTVYQMRAFTRANAAATALVYEGRLADAAAQFERNARRFRTASLHPISVYNLADTCLQLGQVDRALSLASAVASYGGVLKSPLVGASAPALVATCYALRGELDSARAWLPEAQRAAATIAIEAALVPELIVDCREGRYADVVARVEQRRRQLEGTLAGHELRTVRLMLAFALRHLPSTPEDKLREAIAVARPAQPGECDYLALSWPELAAFLRETGIGGANR